MRFIEAYEFTVDSFVYESSRFVIKSDVDFRMIFEGTVNIFFFPRYYFALRNFRS